MLYWYETATFTVNSTSQQKHVKISLIIYPESPEDVKTAKILLLPIASAINDHWQPIKMWSTVALAISQNGLALSAATIALLIALIIYRLFFDQQDKKSLVRLYAKLHPQTQQLITAVQNAQKQGNNTTHGVGSELEKQTKTSIVEEWITEKLEEAQKDGLIKKTITNNNDEPAITWSSQVPQETSIFTMLSQKLLKQKFSRSAKS